MSSTCFLGLFPEAVATAVASQFLGVRLGSRDAKGDRRVWSAPECRLQALAALTANVVVDRPDRHHPRFISSRQLVIDTLRLVPRIPPTVDAIAGVSRSGLAPAAILAMSLHLPLLVVRQSEQDVVPAGHGFRLQDTDTPRHVLVVDDTSMTGRSLADTYRITASMSDRVTTATVYCAPDSKQMPDLWVETLPYPHFLEWNLFNSVFLPGMACDFDGILCEDCPSADDDDGVRYLSWMQSAPLKYSPRKGCIPLVVTARIDKYAEPTRAWLSEKKIGVDRLCMRPERNLQDRQAAYTPEWKAEVFADWAARQKAIGLPAIFVESCPYQAEKIAVFLQKSFCSLFGGFTGVYVICPQTAKVWPVL